MASIPFVPGHRFHHGVRGRGPDYRSYEVDVRVIDEEGIFTLITKESPLEKINNISYKQTILGRILNYGEVEIQTAAEHGATIYPMITDPKMLKKVVANARDEYAKNLTKSPHGDLFSHA